MFFISDSNGNILPVQGASDFAVPISADAAPLTETAVAQVVTDTRSLNSETGILTPAIVQDQDAVVIEQSPFSTRLQGTVDVIASGTLGQAAASVAYRTAAETSVHDGENNDRDTLAPELLKVSPVGAVAADTSEKARNATPSVMPRKNQYPIQEKSDRRLAITVGQIMTTPVVTILDTDSLLLAHNIFHARQFRHLPVISAQGRLVGILSERDFLHLHSLGASKSENLEKPVRELMTSNVLTTGPDTRIRVAAKFMFENRVGAMPILDKSAHLIGILTRSDILRTVVNNAPLELWS